MTDERDPMDPESWHTAPGVCGSCIAWKPEDPRPGEEIAAGICRLRPELHRVPATLKKCNLYKGRGQYVYQPSAAPSSRRKRVAAPRVLRRGEDGQMIEAKPAPVVSSAPRAPRPPREPVARPAAPRTIEVGLDDKAVIRRVIRDLLRTELPASGRELHGRYEGGRVETRVGDRVVKKIDAEQFFEMLDQFRVSLDELEDALVRTDALLPSIPELTQQIRRVQGSFTTFNVLYHDRADYFSGKP